MGAVLTMIDFNARKQAELELSEARQILSNLLNLREKAIHKLMINGSSTKEIAFDLNISHLTVETYRQNMMSKLESGGHVHASKYCSRSQIGTGELI